MIHKASRSTIKPLVCFYAESGCGKTYSSLLLARGFVGPTGKILIADSEQGRGELYADVISGGYDAMPLVEPFSPASYMTAIDEAEKHGAQILIIDSGSHEWEGPGGVLDMAAENEAKGKVGLNVWRIPKLEHAKYVERLKRTKMPVIVCLRAKHKSRQTKDERGKTVIVRDDFTSPITADDFISECTIHGEIMPDHSFRLTKCSHPALPKCFPSSGPINESHGKLLAEWCNQGGSPKDDSKKRLWDMTRDIHGGEKTKLEAWLQRQRIIEGPLAAVTEWATVLEKTEVAMSDVIP